MRFVSLFALALIATYGAAVLAADPVPDLYRRSYDQESLGNYSGALASMDEVKKASAPDYVFHLRCGWLLYLAGRFLDAAKEYAAAVELEPSSVEAKLGAMLPLMAARRWREAEEVADDVLALAPGDFNAQSRLAYIHYSQGRYAKAEAAYRKLVQAFPANVEMRAGLGWSLLKLNKAAQAREELKRVLRIAPDHSSAQRALAAL
ncbi:MAG TPA: tetratricopeptide repeat protein [Anaeromyxobacteraceae bacterium]|nr:tetratricopeptide repeat protein [Anaeromyxobacteraceae bacterium]